LFFIAKTATRDVRKRLLTARIKILLRAEQSANREDGAKRSERICVIESASAGREKRAKVFGFLPLLVEKLLASDVHRNNLLLQWEEEEKVTTNKHRARGGH
jgi:hypothetical protein